MYIMIDINKLTEIDIERKVICSAPVFCLFASNKTKRKIKTSKGVIVFWDKDRIYVKYEGRISYTPTASKFLKFVEEKL